MSGGGFGLGPLGGASFGGGTGLIAVLSAVAVNPFTVVVQFSDNLSGSGTTFNTANYQIPGLTIIDVVADPDPTKIRLLTEAQNYQIYELTVFNVESVSGGLLDPLADSYSFTGWPEQPRFTARAISATAVQVLFAQTMAPTPDLLSSLSYTLTDLQGVPVGVLSAVPNSSSDVLRVRLNLGSALTSGQTYALHVSNLIVTTDGRTLIPNDTTVVWNQPTYRTSIPIRSFTGEVQAPVPLNRTPTETLSLSESLSVSVAAPVLAPPLPYVVLLSRLAGFVSLGSLVDNLVDFRAAGIVKGDQLILAGLNQVFTVETVGTHDLFFTPSAPPTPLSYAYQVQRTDFFPEALSLTEVATVSHTSVSSQIHLPVDGTQGLITVDLPVEAASPFPPPSAVPFVVQVEAEQMQVVLETVGFAYITMSVVRGYNSTTPAPHAVGIPVSYLGPAHHPTFHNVALADSPFQLVETSKVSREALQFVGAESLILTESLSILPEVTPGVPTSTAALFGNPNGQVFFSPSLIPGGAPNSSLQIDNVSVCTKAYDAYTFPQPVDPLPLYTHGGGIVPTLAGSVLGAGVVLFTNFYRLGEAKHNVSDTRPDRSPPISDIFATIKLIQVWDPERFALLNNPAWTLAPVPAGPPPPLPGDPTPLLGSAGGLLNTFTLGAGLGSDTPAPGVFSFICADNLHPVAPPVVLPTPLLGDPSAYLGTFLLGASGSTPTSGIQFVNPQETVTLTEGVQTGAALHVSVNELLIHLESLHLTPSVNQQIVFLTESLAIGEGVAVLP